MEFRRVLCRSRLAEQPMVRDIAIGGRLRVVVPLRVRHRDLDERQQVLARPRSEEHTSELQSLMRISYAVFCLKKKKKRNKVINLRTHHILYTSANSKLSSTSYTTI